MPNRPVFYDPTGRRGRVASRIGWSIAILSTVLFAVFVSALLAVPHMPPLPIERVVKLTPATPSTGQIKAPKLSDAAQTLAKHARAERDKRNRPVAENGGSPPPVSGIAHAPDTREKPMTIGFYVTWDDNSFTSLKRSLPQLDWVVPSWLTLKGAPMALNADVDKKSVEYIRRARPQTPILPMVQNASGDIWDGPGLAKLLADNVQREALAERLTRFVSDNKYQGIVIDFEEVPPTAHRNLRIFLDALHARFKPLGLISAIAAPFDDEAWDYQAVAESTDYVILMAYDEHWSSGEPGPIASQAWFERILKQRMSELDPGKTIIGIGNYGYDWVKGREGVDMSFQETMLAARESSAEIGFPKDALNPSLSYVEDDGQTHDIWFLDAVTAFNQIHAAGSFRPAGYALWRLGQEDPSIWTILGKAYGTESPAGLKTIEPGDGIDFEGTGEILNITATPNRGARTMSVNPKSGLIQAQRYTAIPSSYTIERAGASKTKVALTFDDGPDPVWTPKILDILREKNVKATFFIVGENAQANPGLIHRIVDEGHEVGNHTFTHPNLSDVTDTVATLELNATQRLFESITGRSMRLFRPPYFGDAEPTTQDEIQPALAAQNLGYVTVGLRVDPDDWQQPAPSEIIKRTLAQVKNANPEERGNIVLLHDAGGDRANTVAALGPLIDSLRASGYTLAPVSELAGLTRDQSMPPLPADLLTSVGGRPVFLAMSWASYLIHWAMLAAVALGLARLAFLCGLGLWNSQQEARRIPPQGCSEKPLISVLIPAFNEDKVIAASVARILESDYPALEVIVIDDGSTDATSAKVRAAFSGDERVTLITIPNSGKATAVNTGLQRAKGEIVVALDADTQFERETISRLARWFGDPKTGAVAGNAKVGNRINMITRWQALEYITAQNLERRALAALGCVTVVPGAVGAWRTSVIRMLGGFPTQTLAEDQDLTIGVQRAGSKVIFDASAIAWTEAPDTVRGLAKQRFRWAYGTLQCLWKHRAATFNPKYGALGLFALPQVWLFQILFSVVSPVVDLLLIWQVFATWFDYVQHPDQFDPSNLTTTAFYFAVFVAADLLAGVLAFMLETREKPNLLWWLVLQRFGYRQIMYYVAVKSVMTAIAGPMVGWGKLERKATVTAGSPGQRAAKDTVL